jgi:nitroimidazol reductase NimA-like FMN-containing flavoprotein (pyridoxamine 5'-phosphate oxidase superfamily)
MYNWESTVVYGVFEELKGEDVSKAKLILNEHVMPMLSGSCIHGHEHDEGEGHELIDEDSKRSIFFKIKISEKSGRFQRL